MTLFDYWVANIATELMYRFKNDIMPITSQLFECYYQMLLLTNNVQTSSSTEDMEIKTAVINRLAQHNISVNNHYGSNNGQSSLIPVL